MQYTMVNGECESLFRMAEAPVRHADRMISKCGPRIVNG